MVLSDLVSSILSERTYGISAAFALAVTVLFAAIQVIRRLRHSPAAPARAPSPQSAEKGRLYSSQKNRAPGTWTPIEMTFPKPDPFPEWSLTDTKPLPYRPFKHNYFVTMGIRSLNFKEWIELDNDWMKFHKRKQERMAQENAEELWAVDPRAEDAAYETLELMVDFLPARYPTLFERTDTGIRIIPTDEVYETTARPTPVNPMVIVANLIQDDVAIMIEGDDGQYYLRAGSILLAGFWRLKDKIHMPLYKIHTEGEVPEYKEKLQTPMDRFFTKLTPEKGVCRNNYFIQTDDDVAWSHAIGPEDSDEIGWYTAQSATDPEKLMFRSERQSLRRLPRSGGILFTIRTYFLPVKQIVQEPYVPRRLLNGIKAWNPTVQGYKGLEKYGDCLIPYLEAKAEEQEAKGFLPEDEKANYPF